MTTTSDDILNLKTDPIELRAIGPWLQELSEKYGLADRFEVGAAELAVHEVAMNIVEHAFPNHDGEFTLVASADDGGITIQTRDRGRAFVAEDYSAPVDGEPQIKGYGVMIAEQIADSLVYDREGEENRWTMVFGGR